MKNEKDQKKMGRYAYLTGIAHPDTIKDPYYTGPKLRTIEVPDFCKKMVGYPVMVEHGYPVVGEIMSLQSTIEGDIVAFLKIDLELHGAREVITKVETFEYNGLSIGSCNICDDKEEVFSSFFPYEISIVRKGALDGSSILQLKTDRKLQRNLWAINNYVRDTTLTPPEIIHTPKLRNLENLIRNRHTLKKMSQEEIIAKLQAELAQRDAILAAKEENISQYRERDMETLLKYADKLEDQMGDSYEQFIECVPALMETPVGQKVLMVFNSLADNAVKGSNVRNQTDFDNAAAAKQQAAAAAAQAAAPPTSRVNSGAPIQQAMTDIVGATQQQQQPQTLAAPASTAEAPANMVPVQQQADRVNGLIQQRLDAKRLRVTNSAATHHQQEAAAAPQQQQQRPVLSNRPIPDYLGGGAVKPLKALTVAVQAGQFPTSNQNFVA